jgi:hypothetical protein
MLNTYEDAMVFNPTWQHSPSGAKANVVWATNERLGGNELMGCSFV